MVCACNGKRGRQHTFTDAAIEFCLSIKCLFGLALRQSLGMAQKMGASWFQIRHFEESDGLVALSANFALYGDMSDRMMSLAGGLGHRQEMYSIDESFIDLSGIKGDVTECSRKI